MVLVDPAYRTANVSLGRLARRGYDARKLFDDGEVCRQAFSVSWNVGVDYLAFE